MQVDINKLAVLTGGTCSLLIPFYQMISPYNQDEANVYSTSPPNASAQSKQASK